MTKKHKQKSKIGGGLTPEFVIAGKGNEFASDEDGICYIEEDEVANFEDEGQMINQAA